MQMITPGRACGYFVTLLLLCYPVIFLFKPFRHSNTYGLGSAQIESSLGLTVIILYNLKCNLINYEIYNLGLILSRDSLFFEKAFFFLTKARSGEGYL